jgi:hypothetical protein
MWHPVKIVANIPFCTSPTALFLFLFSAQPKRTAVPTRKLVGTASTTCMDWRLVKGHPDLLCAALIQ